jgi:CRP/FNR family transcriptional regulator, anaerobic regulatory protein
MHQIILDYCNKIYPLAEDLSDDLISHCVIKKYSKDELILRAGSISNYTSVVLEGAARSFYIKNDEEITTQFLPKGSPITSIYSYYGRKPGNEYIIALQDSTLACFHYNDLQKLYKKYPEFNFIGRVVTEQYLYFKEIELYNLRKTKAEDRYRFFTKHFPDLLQQVSLKHIATYLGMNLETLSRIRGKK